MTTLFKILNNVTVLYDKKNKLKSYVVQVKDLNDKNVCANLTY